MAYPHANEVSIFSELDTFSKDPLIKAAYEVSLLLSIARSFPLTSEQNLGNLFGNISDPEIKDKIQKMNILFNLVCGQTYVAHLKELRALNAGEITKADLNLHNYYNIYDITIYSPISNAYMRGASQSAKLLAKGNFEEIGKVGQYCLADLASYLSKAFEKTYQEIFNLETNDEIVNHPYYKHFIEKPNNSQNSKAEF